MALPKKGGSSTKNKVGEFEYKKRDTDLMRARAERRLGSGEPWVHEDVRFFQPKGGNEYEIRIMPPTWEDAEHFGIDIWMHYGIGPDETSYLCPQKMKGEPCPMCAERVNAKSSGDDDMVDALTPRQRVAFYVIDRRDERAGPKLWSCPSGTEKEICAQAQNKKTRSYVDLDDPSEDGYDLSFSVEGQGKMTKYKAIQVDRAPSPLSDDEDKKEAWLAFAQEHPIPDMLIVYDSEHLEDVLKGGVRIEAKNGDDKATHKRAVASEREERASAIKPKGKATMKQKEEEEEEEEEEEASPRSKKPHKYTWQEIEDMTEEELDAAAEEEGLSERDFEDGDSLDDMKAIFAQRMGVEKPHIERGGSAHKGGGVMGKLQVLRNKGKK